MRILQTSNQKKRHRIKQWERHCFGKQLYETISLCMLMYVFQWCVLCFQLMSLKSHCHRPIDISMIPCFIVHTHSIVFVLYTAPAINNTTGTPCHGYDNENCIVQTLELLLLVEMIIEVAMVSNTWSTRLNNGITFNTHTHTEPLITSLLFHWHWHNVNK